MNIFVNNEPRVLTPATTIIELIDQIDLQQTRGVAIAVNNSVIPKSGWNKHTLSENDSITIITATAGG